MRSPRLALAALLIAGLASCRGGCARLRPEARPLGGALALLPSDARFIVNVDVARLRASASWAKLAELVAQEPADKKRFDEIVRATGVDPLRQIESLTLAFPENARTRNAYGLVVRGEGFDEKRLVAWARDQAHKDGYDLRESKRGARVLWTETRDNRTTGFFVDFRTLVIGAGGWAEAMADLSQAAPRGASAEANVELVHLAERAAGAGGGRAVWAAAIVPDETRRALFADAHAGGAAAVSRLAASADLGAGVVADLVADLSNAADAKDMADRVAAAAREAKRNPAVLMMGLGPYLDGVSAHADGPSFGVHLALSEPQVTDLVGRLVGMAKLARGRR